MTKRMYPNINAELSRNGFTLLMLAEHMGITRQALYKKLTGTTQFTAKDMQAIQNFFKLKGCGTLSLDYLFNINK